ncbi:MAG: hypothetical protein WD066_02130 [Planctomycetaceae bacterium]
MTRVSSYIEKKSTAMWWQAAIGVYAGGLVAALLLWGGGLMRANRGDLVLAMCLFVVLTVLMAHVPPLVGTGCILLGSTTLLVWKFASPTRPLNRGDLGTLSAFLIGLGVFLWLIL